MIALLGATGYIGRSLAPALAPAEGSERIVLFARDIARHAGVPQPGHVEWRTLDDFDASEFSLVVNAIGAGDPVRVSAMGAEILDVTRRWDQRVLETMGRDTRYVFLSSGAVYGAFETAAGEDSTLCLPVNRLDSVPAYTLSKLFAEARHRHAPDRAILDVRVFAYADAAIPLDGRFFLAELAQSVVRNTPFETSADDMVRDYVGADELAGLIACWLASGAANAAMDLYSRGPVAKLELLSSVGARYGTRILVQPHRAESPTGSKPAYFTRYHAASKLGYRPHRSSLEIVLGMLDKLVASPEPSRATSGTAFVHPRP